MKSCPLCGTRYDDEGRLLLCQNCYESGLVDGSVEQWQIVRALAVLGGARQEQDLKLIADSVAFTSLCEDALPLVDAPELKNLLKRVLKRIE